MQASGFSIILAMLVLLLLAQAMFTHNVTRIRARIHRIERAHGELSRTVGTVQGWTEQQLRAVRGEFNVARVNDSAERVMAQRARKRGTSAAPPAEVAEDPQDDKRDTLATPPPEPSDDEDDSEATRVFAPEPPQYAPSSGLVRPPAPLAYADQIGSEDVAEEAAYRHLGPDEKTPPRRGRSAMLIATYPTTKEDGADES